MYRTTTLKKIITILSLFHVIWLSAQNQDIKDDELPMIAMHTSESQEPIYTHTSKTASVNHTKVLPNISKIRISALPNSNRFELGNIWGLNHTNSAIEKSGLEINVPVASLYLDKRGYVNKWIRTSSRKLILKL